ncbi:MAG: hypothetical protein ACK56F_18920, partial [bacterium]
MASSSSREAKRTRRSSTSDLTASLRLAAACLSPVICSSILPWSTCTASAARLLSTISWKGRVVD